MLYVQHRAVRSNSPDRNIVIGLHLKNNAEEKETEWNTVLYII